MRVPINGLAGLILVTSVITVASADTSTAAGHGLRVADPACTIIGTAGDDELKGTTARDVICGLAGDDLIRAIGGNDLVFGGPGSDFILGGRGRDVIHGEDDGDSISGGGGNDQLFGEDGGDQFAANRGSGTGNRSDGTDVMSGGPGSDEAFYERRSADLTITLDGLANDGAAGENDQAGVVDAFGDPDVENVRSGTGDDVLVGTDGTNFLTSRGGADTIIGLGGDDSMDAFDGVADDTLNAGDGQDNCAGEPADTFAGCEIIFTGLTDEQGRGPAPSPAEAHAAMHP